MFAIALGLLSVASVLLLARILRGPTVFDRLLAVNGMTTVVVMLIAVDGFYTGRPEFLDIAIVYALIGFVGQVALLKYLRSGRLRLDNGNDR